MLRKLTINVEEDVYEGLHKVVGRGKIGRFLENLARPHVVINDLSTAYKEAANDAEREKAAREWCEGLIADSTHEAR